MPLRNAHALTVRPAGLSDAVDGTNAPPGAMALLQNLIPSPTTRNQYVCRPASVQATNFSGFTTPGAVTALLVLGNLAWGMIGSARNAGKDEPFCYNLLAATFVTISNVTSANSPTSPSPTGDWTPPCINSITNGRIIITHPGYNFGGGYAIGWIDISSFSSNTITGNTNSNNTVNSLSINVLQAGWQVGMSISGVNIPANTYITAIAADGLSITISNAATGTTAGSTFTVAGGTPAAPLYGAGQTSPVALVGQPVDVEQFNGRAWYAIANSVQFSDSLIPTQISNASQALILGDSNPINAVAGLPLTSQVTGGIVQALIAFKGGSEFFQITGDAATNNLAANAVPATVGTLAPNSLCGTPQGLAFISPDGLRLLQFSGICTEPIGAHGEGVNVPFLYAVNPTRICMTYNQNVLRVSVQNGLVSGQPVQEFWYDLSLKTWSGPHTFPAALIQAYQGSPDHGFVAVGSGINAALWTSTATPTANSTYTENSVALNFTYQTVLLPDNQQGAMNAMIETNVAVAVPTNAAFGVQSADEVNGTLGQYVLSGPPGSASIWNSFNWGSAPWGSSGSYFQQVPILWTAPLVFKQMSMIITGASQAAVVLGNLYLKYQTLGYTYAPPL